MKTEQQEAQQVDLAFNCTWWQGEMEGRVVDEVTDGRAKKHPLHMRGHADVREEQSF